MGQYASILNRKMSNSFHIPKGFESDHVVIVTHHYIDTSTLHGLFDHHFESAILIFTDAEHHSMQMSVHDTQSSDAVSNDCTKIKTLMWDGSFDDNARDILLKSYHNVIFLMSLSQTSGRLLRELWSIGLREVLFQELDGWRSCKVSSALLSKFQMRAAATGVSSYLSSRKKYINKLLPMLSRSHNQALSGDAQSIAYQSTAIEHWQKYIERANAIPTEIQVHNTRSVIQYIGCLNSGGAERQLSVLSSGLRSHGYDVSVLTTHMLSGSNAHFLPVLNANNVSVEQAGANASVACFKEQLLDYPDAVSILEYIPEEIRSMVYDLFGELICKKPHILHCWLDHPNIIGAFAGIAARIPKIFISVRNVNPSHFPELHREWMQQWYQVFAESRCVQFVSNSAAGAADYANWIGIPFERFEIIPNGIKSDYLIAESDDIDRESARIDLNLPASDSVLVGVFRLAPEKRPLTFLNVVKRVLVNVPNLRVLIVGIGPMQQQVESWIRQSKFTHKIQLLGQRNDIGRILTASDMLLLTSYREGLPNCVIEAMLHGLPVVATAGGGTVEVVVDGETGILCPVDDIEALSTACTTILKDPLFADQLGTAGRVRAEQEYAAHKMIKRTQELYI